ncbi:MAG: hypothetical protein KDH17_02795 [Rhodocyclaceae bacterium]|nr:hypothetical protein [Rhodocyclaceae bacterium]
MTARGCLPRLVELGSKELAMIWSAHGLRHALAYKPGRGSLVAACACLLVQACAAPGEPRSAEEIVRERSQSRWDARLASDLQTAYSYASPAYRSAFDLKAFEQRFGMGLAHWQSANVTSVVCRESVCDVVVHITYTTPLQEGRVLSSDLKERWVLEEDQWWIHLKV